MIWLLAGWTIGLAIGLKAGLTTELTTGGGDPELGLRDLAALRSQTFAISSYSFLRYNIVELRYAK